jgi:hypothetical protein
MRTKSSRDRWAPLALVASLLAASQGCGNAPDPQTLALRQRFVQTDEPAGALTIAEAREKLGGGGEVSAVGRIGAPGIDPWAKGQAAFVISELLAPPSGHGDSPGHDAANCPFCKRRAAKADATALVQFRDEQGNVLPVDARKLLGVDVDQIVVVQGQGRINEVGVFVIVADKIHLRK